MTIAPNDFTHLHVHSEFSLLDGLGRITELVDTAAQLGMDSMAITDHGALYGAVSSYQAARTKGLTPPDASQLPALVGSSAPVVDRLLQLLVRQKRVFRLDGLPYHRDALDRLRSEVSALKPAGGEAFVDVSSFKTRYGLSRKFAIPLLEYLDRERVTRRVGERRLVL